MGSSVKTLLGLFNGSNEVKPDDSFDGSMMALLGVNKWKLHFASSMVLMKVNLMTPLMVPMMDIL